MHTRTNRFMMATTICWEVVLLLDLINQFSLRKKFLSRKAGLAPINKYHIQITQKCYYSEMDN